MENATKALLIAAAILIAILIISLSLVVYRMASETVGNVDLSEAEIAAHNSKFEAFAGDRVSGKKVNAMMKTALTHNEQEMLKGVNDDNDPNCTFVEVRTDSGAYWYEWDDYGIYTRADDNKYYKVTCQYKNGRVFEIVVENVK